MSSPGDSGAASLQLVSLVLAQPAPHPDRLRPADAKLELQAVAANRAAGAQARGQLPVGWLVQP